MSDELLVALNAMTGVVQTLNEVAEKLRSAGKRTESLEISKDTAGMFSTAIDKYTTVPAYVRDRMAEGAVVMDDIADVLRHARDTYAAENANFAQQIDRQTGEL